MVEFSRRQMVAATAALPLGTALPAFANTVHHRLDMETIGAIPRALQSYIDKGDLSGIVTMTCQRGKIVQVNTLGLRDIESRSPMQRDTLFRLASMTKPITTSAVLMLMDEGKLKLSDPVTKWIPELANRRVLRKPDGPLGDTVRARRDITIEDLLTHRSGLGYGFTSVGPIARAYDAAIGRFPDSRSRSTDEYLAALGTLPLFYEPGERMNYGASTDVLGLMLERIEGKRLMDVLQARIFGPLGMKDTGFWVSPAKRDRLATLYQFDERKGALGKVVDGVTARNINDPPAVCSGGGGLISSADDYMTFARMLQGGGRLGPVRLLKPETVRVMRTNRLTRAQRQFPFIGLSLWRGMGFGLGVATVEERTSTNISNGSVGSYTWPGAYGTWWQNDPVQDLTLIYMIQQAYPLSPDAGAVIAGGRGVEHREALPLFERMTYKAIGSPPPYARRY